MIVCSVKRVKLFWNAKGEVRSQKSGVRIKPLGYNVEGIE
jgi:hypothetical protein